MARQTIDLDVSVDTERIRGSVAHELLAIAADATDVEWVLRWSLAAMGVPDDDAEELATSARDSAIDAAEAEA